WPDNHGFINGYQDTTGLVHLGARDYDPAIGRFATVDPILDLAAPQQWNGYAYSDNNPIDFTDPTGEHRCYDEGDSCSDWSPDSARPAPAGPDPNHRSYGTGIWFDNDADGATINGVPLPAVKGGPNSQLLATTMARVV